MHAPYVLEGIDGRNITYITCQYERVRKQRSIFDANASVGVLASTVTIYSYSTSSSMQMQW